VLVLLAPIWLVRFPPLLDYPNHLASTFVLNNLRSTDFLFHAYYGADWRPYPNLTSEILLMILQHVLPVRIAGQVVLSLSVLALPCAAWFFLEQVSPGEGHLAAWSLLIVFNPFLLMGFLNYDLSIALCFLAVGLWLRYLKEPAAGRWWGLLAVVTLLYFTHLGGFVVAGFVMFVYGLLSRLPLKMLLKSWAVFLPGVAFLLTLVSRGANEGGSQWLPFAQKIRNLATPLLGYSFRTDLITCILLAGVVAILVAGNRELRWRMPWLGVAAALLAVYLLLPEAYASTQTDTRLLPFLFIVGLAVAQVGHRGKLLIPVALLIFGVRMAVVTRYFLAEQSRMAGWAESFAVTPRNVRVLPLVEGPDGPGMEKPYSHFWAYGIIQRGWLVPYLFSRKDIHVVRIRAQAYTPQGMGYTYRKTPDWAHVEQDYDYVWAYNVPEFSAELSAIGVPIYHFEKLVVYRLSRQPGNRVRKSNR
jgi:hypothetical protein